MCKTSVALDSQRSGEFLIHNTKKQHARYYYVSKSVLEELFCNDQSNLQGVGTPLDKRITDESDDRERHTQVASGARIPFQRPRLTDLITCI
jgi:hypothetical protein